VWRITHSILSRSMIYSNANVAQSARDLKDSSWMSSSPYVRAYIIAHKHTCVGKEGEVRESTRESARERHR